LLSVAAAFAAGFVGCSSDGGNPRLSEQTSTSPAITTTTYQLTAETVALASRYKQLLRPFGVDPQISPELKAQLEGTEGQALACRSQEPEVIAQVLKGDPASLQDLLTEAWVYCPERYDQLVAVVRNVAVVSEADIASVTATLREAG
jgi:hypothetical protein